MKTRQIDESTYVFRLMALLAVFVGGTGAGALLAVPLPAGAVGLGAVLLALRIGVMLAGADEDPAVTPARRAPAPASPQRALHAANG